MENKLISHWLFQTLKQRRIEGGEPPSSPPLEAPMQGAVLRVISKARSVCQLCGGCRALQCSREKFTAHGQSLNKYLCQLCPLRSLAPKREFASSHLKPRTSPGGNHQGGNFHACAGGVRLGWSALMSQQCNQHRSMLVLTAMHTWHSRALELSFPF